jgi:AraC-like DNA-binding protein
MPGKVPERCTVVAWSPPVPGIAEVFHAHIVDWSYPRHCHDSWAVLLVDDGAITYDLDARRNQATPRSVTVIPPGVVHDGRPAPGANGFHKRELYLDPDFLPADLIGPAVDRTNLIDEPLAGALSALHHSLAAGNEVLDAEGRLMLIADRLVDAFAGYAGRPRPVEPTVAHTLRELLDEHVVSGVTLAACAAELGRSRGHLVRSFTREFGISPHAYLLARRIDLARRRLLLGVPPSRVATETGFHDQAHLTRHFRRHLTTTPARFASRAGTYAGKYE